MEFTSDGGEICIIFGAQPITPQLIKTKIKLILNKFFIVLSYFLSESKFTEL